MNILETLRREGLDGKFFTLVQDGERYKVIDIKQPRPSPKLPSHTGPRPAHWAKPGQRPQAITQEQRDTAERMYLAGARYRDIRDALSMNYKKMQTLMAEVEAKHPREVRAKMTGAWLPRDVERLISMQKQNFTQKEMALALGRTVEAIESRLLKWRKERR